MFLARMTTDCVSAMYAGQYFAACLSVTTMERQLTQNKYHCCRNCDNHRNLVAIRQTTKPCCNTTRLKEVFGRSPCTAISSTRLPLYSACNAKLCSVESTQTWATCLTQVMCAEHARAQRTTGLQSMLTGASCGCQRRGPFFLFHLVPFCCNLCPTTFLSMSSLMESGASGGGCSGDCEI